MSYFDYSLIKIGIIGGGQLGKMMTQAAKKMGFYVEILDPIPDCSAAQVADKQIVGDFYDENKLREMVSQCDVTTFDIERAGKSLIKLANEGYLIYPSPQILYTIQDKTKQKEMLIKNDIPIPKYKKVEGLNIDFITKEFGFPVVQKACKEGYDGRGVFVIKDRNDIKKAIKAESFLEKFIDFEKELAINVARNTKGEIKCHPVVEMIFDERANICDMVIAPARVSEEIKREAEKIGIKTVKALGKEAVGIFGIEMFLTKDGRILVNEISPRPHNSGHYTIEACLTCQFEQHIRAVAGLPLGSTKLLSPAVMINLLGEKGYEGAPIIEGLNEALSIPGLSFHFYDKKITRSFRKMGHITILDENLERAIEKAKGVKDFLKIKAR